MNMNLNLIGEVANCYYDLVADFLEIIDYEPADDDIKASLQEDCAVVDLVSVLDRFDYDAEEEFPRKLFSH